MKRCSYQLEGLMQIDITTKVTGIMERLYLLVAQRIHCVLAGGAQGRVESAD